ncbi:hypothetical protein OAU50_01365 [Planctomycetota bacterium]|nr:hypothetical protein [Planctomycetota bacterium]
MAKSDTKAVTYYVGFVNILLAIVWTAGYTLGFIHSDSVTNPSATPFYVGTLFAVGFGLIYPSVEGSTGRSKIRAGIFMSVVALVCYAGLVAGHFVKGGLVLYDLKAQLFG